MKADQPLVSIALCTYNGEKYLRQQLDSLLAQSYSNLEIIIVDDASIDGTIALLKQYQGDNSNIKLVLNEQNIGFNQNFKKAIELCTANLIAIADQDDIWESEKISLLVDNIGDNLLLYHDSAYIDQEGNLTGKNTTSHHRFVSGNCAENLIYYNCISGHACLIKKELLSLTPEFDPAFYYDWWLAYTAACTGKINFITQKLVRHRKHSASSTGNDKTDARKLRIKHFQLFINHPLTSKPLKQLLIKLSEHYQQLDGTKFSFSLFNLLLTKASSLFFIRKKSLYSQIRFIIKESSGNKG
jgi:glycosyltransferase involved in cell wall biosynthesis